MPALMPPLVATALAASEIIVLDFKGADKAVSFKDA
jgi:hypothetical protein